MASEEMRAIEAIVMVSEEPVSTHMLAQLLEIGPDLVEQMCRQLAASYEAEDRGFELVRVAGGYRFQSHPDLAAYVERFVLDGQSARLSAAALETLAIVAYKQPVSRAQVAAIRGVNSDAVMRTLQTRGLIHEVSRDPGPGQAGLYGTTTLLLERLGLDSVSDLPPLAQFVPGAEIMDSLERSLRADPPAGAGAGAESSAARSGTAPGPAGRGPGEGHPAVEPDRAGPIPPIDLREAPGEAGGGNGLIDLDRLQ